MKWPPDEKTEEWILIAAVVIVGIVFLIAAWYA